MNNNSSNINKKKQGNSSSSSSYNSNSSKKNSTSNFLSNRVYLKSSSSSSSSTDGNNSSSSSTYEHFEDGILLINKRKGLTSVDVDYRVRRVFKTKKVGHLGTLDPFAEGLLIVGVNEGTKVLPYLDSSKKTYIGKLVLGKTTVTLDDSSVISEEETVVSSSLFNERDSDYKTIREVFNLFNNGYTYPQYPPKYSSKSVNGVRAYTLARSNIPFELKSYDVTIYSMEILNIDPYKHEITFKTIVSPGTYIRSLGSDIASKLNTIGYLTYLQRTNISGIYDISDSVHIDNLNRERDLISFDKIKTPPKKEEVVLIPSSKGSNGADVSDTSNPSPSTSNYSFTLYNTDYHIDNYFLNKEEFHLFKYGNKVHFKYIGDKVFLFYGGNVIFLMEYDKETEMYRTLRGFNYEYYKDKD